MLETLRQGVQSWYFKALLVLLIGSFAIWGVGDIFRDGPAGSNAMTVGGKEVGGVQIYRTVRQRLKSYVAPTRQRYFDGTGTTAWSH